VEKNDSRKRLGFWMVLAGFWALLAVVLVGGLGFLFPANHALDRAANPILGPILASVGDAKMIRFEFQPYTGFHHPANADVEEVFRGQRYHFRTNNYGFLTPYTMYPFNAGRTSPGRFEKGANDRVVLLSGGSAAYGWGASSNERTISYVLAAELNRRDPAHRWHVVNLAMGGWIAYQQQIALDLYGSEFDGDWIVLFDGRNDIYVPTIQGERVPNYFLSTGQRRLDAVFDDAEHLSAWQRMPVFAYRRLADRLQQVGAPLPAVTTSEEFTNAVRFYKHSLERIVARFHDRKILLMTQPLSEYPSIVAPAYARLISEVGAMAAGLPNCTYVDATGIFPGARPGDGNFIDDCHLTDSAQRVVAERMAVEILARERAPVG